MEPTIRMDLYGDLSDWGYSLLRTHAMAKPDRLLQELVHSDDLRLLEGFPVVLCAWLRKELLGPSALEMTEEGLESAGDKKRFRLLTGISWQLMLALPESDKQRALLRNYLESRDKNVLSEVRTAFAEGKSLNAGKVKLSPDRLQNTFNNYVIAALKQKTERLSEQIERTREIAFNEALAELFSDRQMEIVRKILARQALTKTEREYFSRVIKKRMAAIGNTDLQTLAASVVGRPDIFIRGQSADEL
jgi:hypothetical protein